MSPTLQLRRPGDAQARRENAIEIVRPTDRVRASILRHVFGVQFSDLVNFSESLGPIANQNLSLWLAVLGASRIIGIADEFSKRQILPLSLLAFRGLGLYSPGATRHRPSMFLAKSVCRKQTVQREPGREEFAAWEALMHDKWLDPLRALSGAFEIVRPSQQRQQLDLLHRMGDNLNRYFGNPDTAINAKLVGLRWCITPGSAPPARLSTTNGGIRK
jgi:hypothetical protein